MTLDSESTYDRWAISYDAHPNPTVAMARYALERDLKDVRGKSVFEFGCGTGENLVNLGRRGAGPLYGADVSKGMLAQARTKLTGFAPGLFHVEEGEPAFATGREFDLILAVLVLEHVLNIDDFFGAAAKQITKDGAIYVSELHPAQSSKGIQAHFRDSEGIEISTHSFHRTEADFIGAAHRSGLEVDFVNSWVPDDDVVEREPKILKYKDQSLLLTMMFVKP